MNDSEVQFPPFDEIKTPSAETSTLEAPLKLGSSKHKLRQLVKKSSVTSTHSNSPNQTQQQLSKQALEATLWETCSPGVSRVSDSSHQVSTKAKHNPSPNPKSKAHHKPVVRSPSYGMHVELDNNKVKEIGKRVKPKSNSYLGNLSLASSPKGGDQDFYFPELVVPSTTQHNNAKDSEEDTRMERQNSVTDDEDDARNLSLEIKTKSFMAGQNSKKSSMTKNASRENSSAAASSKHEIKELEDVKEEVEKPKHKKSKSKTVLKSILPDPKRNQKSNSSVNMNVGKKSNLQISNVTFYDVEKNKREREVASTKNAFSKIRKAVTPDNLTSREAEESNAPLENKRDKLTPKLDTIYKDILARKASMPGPKESGLGAKKRPTSSNKLVKQKSGPKPVKKEKDLLNENVGVAVINKPKRSGTLDNLIPRTTKGSSPNIFAGLVAGTVCSSTKNQKRAMDSQVLIYGDHGDYEKNVVSSNEVTICGTQDTTVNMRNTKKDTVNSKEEGEEKMNQDKRFMRAKSQGGPTLVEDILKGLNKNEKQKKGGVKVKGKGASMAVKHVKDKKSQDGAGNLIQGQENSPKKELNHNVLSIDSAEALEQKGLEDSQSMDKVTMLMQILERTNRMLAIYKDRETEWQSEREELISQITRLQEKDNMY